MIRFMSMIMLITMLNGCGDGSGTQNFGGGDGGAGDGAARSQSFFDEAEIRYYKTKHGIDTTSQHEYGENS